MYPLVSFRREFPLEVQEHIIDQSNHSVQSLRLCALTCRAWHFRSRFHLLRAIRVRSKEELDEICSYLRTHTFLRPLIQSVVCDNSYYPRVAPARLVSDLVCTPFLNQLPNIRRCELFQSGYRPIVFHPSILTYLKVHSHIETLCLRGVTFSSPTSFVELLAAFPLLKHLVCDGIHVKQMHGSVIKLGSAYNRKPIKLRCLEVRDPLLHEVHNILPLAGGTVEHLVVGPLCDPMADQEPLPPLEMVKEALAGVTCFKIHVRVAADCSLDFMFIKSLLPAFSPDGLKELSVVFEGGTSYEIRDRMQTQAATGILASLQQTLLGMSRLKSMTFAARTAMQNRQFILSEVLNRSFPLLGQKLAKTVSLNDHIGHDSPIHTLVVSPDGLWIASADDDSVILWRTEDGSIVQDWNVPQSAQFHDIARFSPDSRRIAICATDQLILRDVRHPSEIVAKTSPQHGVQWCTWSSDSALCAVFEYDEQSTMSHIRIYRTATLEAISDHSFIRLRRTWTERYSRTTWPLFSNDSSRILLMERLTDIYRTDGDFESVTWIWDLSSTAPPRKLMNCGAAVVLRPVFNPVNSSQVFLTLADGTIQVRDVESGIALNALHVGSHENRPLARGSVLSLYPYSRDGRRIATEMEDGRTVLCNLETGAVTTISTDASPYLPSPSFSPDGTRILSITSQLRVWDTNTGRLLLTMDEHITGGDFASFSPDGRYIASGHWDGVVRLWNANDGTCLAIYTEHDSTVTYLAFSADGKILCSTAQDRTVHVHHLRKILQH